MGEIDIVSNAELLELVLIGCFGSCAIEIVTLIRYKVLNTIPSFYTSVSYWILRLFLVVTAGELVYVYVRAGIDINPIIALNIGVAAPLLIEKFSQDTHIPKNEMQK